jgi:8-oxo-dGTP pyrophosphatase MutT (NUDIX family)
MSRAGASHPWPSLQAARHQIGQRVPLLIDGQAVGSVAEPHAPALARWPHWIRAAGPALHLTAEPAARDEALAEMNRHLRAEGLIVAWRDEVFPLYEPASGVVLATFERASTRFWGTMTRGAHCNGYLASADGRPTHLWIARRSLSKATDPGKRDNLIGGGVPHGQTPRETVVREGWEEAGLTPELMQRVTEGRVIRIDCDVPEGRMVEHVHVFDLALPPGLTPVNQDGEVAEIHCLPVEEAWACAASGEMTTDASLVTLDFLLRHGLLPMAEQQRLAAQMAPLWAPAADR